MYEHAFDERLYPPFGAAQSFFAPVNSGGVFYLKGNFVFDRIKNVSSFDTYTVQRQVFLSFHTLKNSVDRIYPQGYNTHTPIGINKRRFLVEKNAVRVHGI